ncbi:MAG: zinc-binding dehydrogenase [Nostoc sp.]
MGAKKVIPIDRFPQRLEMAKKFAKAEVINYKKVNAGETLKETTGGRGPNACIDAVGLADFYDQTKQKLRLETDRSHVLREMIVACRKGRTFSIMSVNGAFVDKIPFGAGLNKGLIFRMGQMHRQKYIKNNIFLIADDLGWKT